MNKIVFNTIMVSLIIGILGMISVTYLSFFYMQEPYVFHNEPIPVLQENGNLCVDLEFTSFTDAKINITRTYKDGIIFVTSPITATGHELGDHNITVCFPVPSTLPEGLYIIQTDLEFEITPFTTRHAHWQTMPIYIKKG